MIVKAVKYGAEWCAPCKLTEENLKKSGLLFESVDVDENGELAESKEITVIPVVEFYDENGNITKKHVGLLTLDKIKEILAENHD